MSGEMGDDWRWRRRKLLSVVDVKGIEEAILLGLLIGVANQLGEPHG